MSVDLQPSARSEATPETASPAQLGVLGRIKNVIGKALGQQNVTKAATETVPETREGLIQKFVQAQLSGFDYDKARIENFARAVAEMNTSDREFFHLHGAASRVFVFAEGPGVKIFDLSHGDNANHRNPAVRQLALDWKNSIAIVCVKWALDKEFDKAPSLDPHRPGVAILSAVLSERKAEKGEISLFLEPATLPRFLEGLARLDARKQQALAAAAVAATAVTTTAAS